jgi:hypothetical protein
MAGTGLGLSEVNGRGPAGSRLAGRSIGAGGPGVPNGRLGMVLGCSVRQRRIGDLAEGQLALAGWVGGSKRSLCAGDDSGDAPRSSGSGAGRCGGGGWLGRPACASGRGGISGGLTA